MKLALNTDSIDDTYSYAYYCYYAIKSLIELSPIDIELTSEFKSDINSLTPEQIVKKYGTHALTSIKIGAKFEILYRCEFKDDISDIEDGFNYRINEFFGGFIPGMVISGNFSSNGIDHVIFNSMGSKIKMSGLINATDNNDKGIFINTNNLYNDNFKSQFISVRKDGAVPLYDLIYNSENKLALKNYIESYTTK
jgi:hypothetical protein